MIKKKVEENADIGNIVMNTKVQNKFIQRRQYTNTSRNSGIKCTAKTAKIKQEIKILLKKKQKPLYF